MFRGRKWSAVGKVRTVSSPQTVSYPTISYEALSLIDRNQVSPIIYSGIPLKPESQSPTGGQFGAKNGWQFFRDLVAYYRRCIRNEEGADASAFQNHVGKSFLYLRKTGIWYPRPGIRWRMTIPLGAHLSPLLNALPGPDQEEALVVGYPVHAFFRQKEGEPALSIIRPIFSSYVDHELSSSGLSVFSGEPRFEVNLGWLEYAFKNNPDRRQGFLSACGLINRQMPIDEAPSIEKGEILPGLETLSTALAAFIPERLRECLDLENVSDLLLQEPFESGIYNRAVLLIAKRTRYTATLLKELVAIERMPDEILKKTALRHVFMRNGDTSALNPDIPAPHESIVCDASPLNAEQRLATASMLTRGLTVVTGPPGTGKSQVVSAVIANARLRGETVLFSTRNHKAIDAVVGRSTDPDGNALVVRANSRDDPTLRFTFSEAIRQMLSDHPEPMAASRLKPIREELSNSLYKRGVYAELAQRAIMEGMKLGELEERLSWLSENLSGNTTKFIDTNPESFPFQPVEKLITSLRALKTGASERSFLMHAADMFHTLMRYLWYRKARIGLDVIPDMPELPALPTILTMQALLPILQTLEKTAEYAKLRLDCRPIEEEVQRLPELACIVKEVGTLTRRIAELTPRALTLDMDVRRGLAPDGDREALSGLRTVLTAMNTHLEQGSMQNQALRELSDRSSQILRAFPCWAVTSLSVGSRIPLLPGLFDLAIVDEASQSDMPSAIPILFRAARAGVVGDPCQLTHVTRLSTARDTMLRREVQMNRVEDARFTYSENSLFDLFAGTDGVTPVFLSETYRSDGEIASYSNQTFYNGRLRVATDTSRLRLPQGFTRGIQWTDVTGEVKSGGGSGCYCGNEVDAVVNLLRTMLLSNLFQGTVGVVTPFRQQANRIRDALYEGDQQLYEALVRADAHVDTAHGFQGDERDVIVFSLCAGPGMPAGSISFIRESRNLFNVAASRARALLHVIGNLVWAKSCGIRHVVSLADPGSRSNRETHRGPWHPHESPYEKILFEALQGVGLRPRPQFPTIGRRLDMALVGEGEHSKKIDIEVDGDCHRNSDGTRKLDDIWRDIQLAGAGWQVIRFWTYQLREDLDGCVNRVCEEWNRNEY